MRVRPQAVPRTADIAQHAKPAARQSTATLRDASPVQAFGGFDFGKIPVRPPILIQAKLRIGSTDDPAEREADGIAERVMRMPQDASCVRAAPASAAASSNGAPAPSIVHDVLSTPGRPLDAAARTFFEPRFGHDFGGVRVHAHAKASESAEAIGARAYTAGPAIVFGQGQYAPETHDGRKLIAHELAHVVQQSSALAAPVRRKIEMKGTPGPGGAEVWNEMSNKDEAAFIKSHYKDPADQSKAKAILDDMADAGDPFYFDSDAELVSELSKRMKTVQYLRQSQYSQAFGYPDVGYEKDAKKLDPRVNKEARAYWGPVQDRNDDYFFQLNDKGKNEPYQALIRLFKSQGNKADRTLIHCDYLVSVVHMRAFAETIGVAEFEKRVKAGTIPLTLKWDGFTDIETGSSEQKSLQEVRPSSERDLVIGDHVVFWNHRAYDLINQNIGEAWRLENAVLEKKLNGVDIFEGHGSGQQTNDTMRAALLKRYNEVTDKAFAIISKTKSHDAKTKTAAVADMASKFPNVLQVGTDWNVQGDAHGKPYDAPVKRVTNIHDPDLIGLRDPADLTKMNEVKRPIESAK